MPRLFSRVGEEGILKAGAASIRLRLGPGSTFLQPLIAQTRPQSSLRNSQNLPPLTKTRNTRDGKTNEANQQDHSRRLDGSYGMAADDLYEDLSTYEAEDDLDEATHEPDQEAPQAPPAAREQQQVFSHRRRRRRPSSTAQADQQQLPHRQQNNQRPPTLVPYARSASLNGSSTSTPAAAQRRERPPVVGYQARDLAVDYPTLLTYADYARAPCGRPPPSSWPVPPPLPPPSAPVFIPYFLDYPPPAAPPPTIARPRPAGPRPLPQPPAELGRFHLYSASPDHARNSTAGPGQAESRRGPGRVAGRGQAVPLPTRAGHEAAVRDGKGGADGR